MRAPTLDLMSLDRDSQTSFVVSIPIIGLGTYKFRKTAADVSRVILDALEIGYRHIDTAFIYGGEQTEIHIGSALKKANIPRHEIFLTTKQWRAYHGYDETKRCLEISLQRLQVNYVDLYLIHWPGPAKYVPKGNMEDHVVGQEQHTSNQHYGNVDMKFLRAETWRAMEDALHEGKVRAIGVSNFAINHLEELRKTARIWPPAVNQMELHPYNPQTKLVHYCQSHGIVVQAYASLGGQDVGKKTWKSLGGHLLDREEVLSIAKKHNRTAAQVLLRWATQQGFIVIPKSSSVDHLVENLEAVTNDSLWKNGGMDQDDINLLASLDQSTTSNMEKTRLCWVNDPLKMLNFD